MAASDLMILTPLFFGDTGGASVYYQILAAELMRSGLRVTVVGDREHGTAAVDYRALWPCRSARSKSLRDYGAYFVQNLQYLRLPALVAATRPRTILVHSSFHNYPGVFGRAMARIRRGQPKIRLIADARDRLLPARYAHGLACYDGVIACAENVANHLSALGVAPGKIARIPVIQDDIAGAADDYRAVLHRHGLDEERYIVYAGSIREEKAVDLLIDAFVRYFRPAFPAVPLVLVGLTKTRSHEMRARVEQPGVVSVGNLPRREVLALMRGAGLCVNLSPNEGFPRASLEALTLGRPSLLPPNVPEFATYCPEHVVGERDPEAVGERLVRAYSDRSVPRYPIERHRPAAVIPLYRSVLCV